MSIGYDSRIIEAAAADLYEQAETIVRSTMIKYGFVFFIFGLFLGAFLGNKFHNDVLIIIIAIIFTIVGVYFGRVSAAAKAFQLKLQAQVALCQVEIEKNGKSRV